MSKPSSDERPPYASWLLLLPGAAIYAGAFLIPLVLLVVSSLRPSEAGGLVGAAGATLVHYQAFLFDGVSLSVFWATVRLAAIVTFVCLLLSYPLALYMRRAGPRQRIAIMLVVVSPLLTSVIVRNVAWLLVLGREGLINDALRFAGIIDTPLPLMYNSFGVAVGVVHVYLSFLVLPLFASLLAINPDIEENAASLGASPLQVFLQITLPLSLPGAIAGSTLVFILTMGVYLTPVIMGGNFVITMPMVITDLVRNQYEWSKSAAFAVLLLLFVSLVMAGSHFLERRLTAAGRR